MNNLIIDLCCGLGRFPSSNVVSIDIDRKVKPTIIADVRYLPLRPKLKPKLCHASPSCRYLSYARLHHHNYNVHCIAESLRIVAACFDAFDYLEPGMWTLENPRGLLNKIMPHNIKVKYSSYDIENKTTCFWTSDMRGLKRSLIPMDVRQKILQVARERVSRIEHHRR